MWGLRVASRVVSLPIMPLTFSTRCPLPALHQFPTKHGAYYSSGGPVYCTLPCPSLASLGTLSSLPWQHFRTEDGAYYGGSGPSNCSAMHSLPAVQNNASVRARVEAGGWYNAPIKPLVPLLGEAHLRIW